MWLPLLWLLVQCAGAAGGGIRSAGELLAAESASNVDSFLHKRRGHGATSLKSQYPFYHTTSELEKEAQKLVDSCNGAASFRRVNDSGVALAAVRVRRKEATPQNRVFLLFGEHARELIGPESGLHLLRLLCGAKDAQGGAEGLLQDNEFELVLNANPKSREEVERGNYCVRTNPKGVDLNRNWDINWEAESMAVDTFPGEKPFSEPETRLLRDLLSDFKPTTFLTVHSGTRGMYMPWAFDMVHMADRNQATMMQILKKLDAAHCQCPYGAAGREVGYACPGTCVDWAYGKLKVPYSFAFEIFTSPDMGADLKSRWEEKLKSGGSALLETGADLGHAHFGSLFEVHQSDFVSRPGHLKGRLECFSTYNPTTEAHYNSTVENWAHAYLEMAQMTAEALQQKASES